MNSRALFISIIASALAVFFVQSYVSSIEEENDKKFGSQLLVMVAKEDIKEMQTLTEKVLEYKPIPKKFLEPAAVSVDPRESDEQTRKKDLKKLLSKYGTYNIDCKTTSGSIYRLHLFPLEYDEKLAFYYNNNQKFLQKRLYPNVLKKSKIFEKEEIRWICVDDLLKMKKQFRFFYIPTLERLTREKEGIKVFIEKSLLGNRKYNSKKGTKRLRFQKNKTRRMKF